MSAAMIEVEHLSKSYGGFEAVRDISFSVERGSVVGFLGPNGAGKSTTLRILAGFLGATAGRVSIAGHDIVEQRLQALGKLGYMPETSPLYPEMRVREYLAFRAELKGVKRRRRGAEVGRALELARVDDMSEVLIGHLSKGYRQRVGLADALLGSPPLLILDEPSAGLDPNQIRDVRALIRDLSEDHTIFLSTHILPEVEAVCARVIVIAAGGLVATGPIESIRQRGGGSGAELLVTSSGRRRDRRAMQEVRDAIEVFELVERVELQPGPGAEALRAVVHFDGEQLGTRGDQGVGPAIEELVAVLTDAGIGIRKVVPLAASLEDVFRQLTEESDSAAAAAAPSAPESDSGSESDAAPDSQPPESGS
jgi:ABC-2 type transport system ATP-binding protein